MSKCWPLAGINLIQDRRFQVKVCIRKIWWLPIFFERFITPCYKVELTNEGEDISKGMVECDIVEHDDPHSYLAIKKEFINFQNFSFKNFKSNSTLKFNCKVSPNFIKPSRFIIRFLIYRYVPDTQSLYEDLLERGVITSKEDLAIIEKRIPDFKKPKEGVCKGALVGDYRWNEVIMIQPLATLLAFVVIIIGGFSLIVS